MGRALRLMNEGAGTLNGIDKELVRENCLFPN
jgi:hypothetical protein